MVIKLLSIARRTNADSPMQEIFSGEVSLDDGLLGDSKGKAGPRQITILSKESWLRACDDLGVDLPCRLSHYTRTNLDKFEEVRTAWIQRQYHCNKDSYCQYIILALELYFSKYKLPYRMKILH